MVGIDVAKDFDAILVVAPTIHHAVGVGVGEDPQDLAGRPADDECRRRPRLLGLDGGVLGGLSFRSVVVHVLLAGTQAEGVFNRGAGRLDGGREAHKPEAEREASGLHAWQKTSEKQRFGGSGSLHRHDHVPLWLEFPHNLPRTSRCACPIFQLQQPPPQQACPL